MLTPLNKDESAYNEQADSFISADCGGGNMSESCERAETAVSVGSCGTAENAAAEAESEGVRLLREERERINNLVRPKINAVKAVLNITLPLSACAAIFCSLYFTLPRRALAISLCASLIPLCVYIAVRTKSILIWLITVYQAVAPVKVRLRCVFTPTCSQYAIDALNKYGVLKGVPKIISRLRRCHPPNGGRDEA